MKKTLTTLLVLILLIIASAFIFVSSTWNKTFEAPLPDITAGTDSTLLARGEYLVYGPAHCAICHVDMSRMDEIARGVRVPLSGGWELPIPPGTFRAPNITPDPETGIGLLSDGQIARAMRYSVSHDNKFMMPFMPFQEMSDSDIRAVISYLRSREPVKNDMKRSEYTFLGKALLAFGALKPAGPKNDPPNSVMIDSTIAYGAYLANSVANCMGCHTDRDMKTGEFTGTPFAGGLIFEGEDDPMLKGHSFIAPNLTPDKETGIMAFWDEATFIKRFREGRKHEGSPMPWESFAQINELELKALYRFFHNLEPVSNKIDKVVYKPGEDFPG